jgi:ATP-binding cassette subfamily B protein
VFQYSNQYAFDVAGNITISDVKSAKDPHDVIGHAGIDLNDTETYPMGIKTMLLREFDGVELSGGQWQRIGTARGLYREHEFIVLDEPTSAIDPIEEARMYERFARLVRGKMAILVTHRLGSVKIADRIAVMDGGTIVETGTHDSLITAKGKYAEMWTAQAEGYAGTQEN